MDQSAAYAGAATAELRRLLAEHPAGFRVWLLRSWLPQRLSRNAAPAPAAPYPDPRASRYPDPWASRYPDRAQYARRECRSPGALGLNLPALLMTPRRKRTRVNAAALNPGRLPSGSTTFTSPLALPLRRGRRLWRGGRFGRRRTRIFSDSPCNRRRTRTISTHCCWPAHWFLARPLLILALLWVQLNYF